MQKALGLGAWPRVAQKEVKSLALQNFASKDMQSNPSLNSHVKYLPNKGLQERKKTDCQHYTKSSDYGINGKHVHINKRLIADMNTV
jgi:hypothetical protein